MKNCIGRYDRENIPDEEFKDACQKLHVALTSPCVVTLSEMSRQLTQTQQMEPTQPITCTEYVSQTTQTQDMLPVTECVNQTTQTQGMLPVTECVSQSTQTQEILAVTKYVSQTTQTEQTVLVSTRCILYLLANLPEFINHMEQFLFMKLNNLQDVDCMKVTSTSEETHIIFSVLTYL